MNLEKKSVVVELRGVGREHIENVFYDTCYVLLGLQLFYYTRKGR